MKYPSQVCNLAQQFIRLCSHNKIAFRQAVNLVGPNRELYLTPSQVNIVNMVDMVERWNICP